MTKTVSRRTQSGLSTGDIEAYARTILMMDVGSQARNVTLVLHDLHRLRQEQNAEAAEGAFGCLSSTVAGLCATPAESIDFAELKIKLLDQVLSIFGAEHPLLAVVVEAAQQEEKRRWWPN